MNRPKFTALKVSFTFPGPLVTADTQRQFEALEDAEKYVSQHTYLPKKEIWVIVEEKSLDKANIIKIIGVE